MTTIVSRTLSVHQEHEFLGALERAGLNKDDAQNVIQSPENELAARVVALIRGEGAVEAPITEAEKRVIAILGKNKVIGAAVTFQKWGLELAEVPNLLVSEEVLVQCARENEAGTADWRLVYVLGSSLRKQRDARGTNRKNQPCFYGNDWWLNKREDSWATQGVGADYRLLNFKLQFMYRKWQEQEDDIAALGSDFERAEEQAVAEACLSTFMVKGERLLQNTFHWGRSLDSSGSRVLVGRFVPDGFHVVDDYWPDNQGPAVGVVVARKF